MTAPYVTAPSLAALETVRHGFFCRLGGHSENPYASNNMSTSTGDTADRVEANRTDAAKALGYAREKLYFLKQTHSNTVVTLKQTADNSVLLEADALVTNQPGQALGILTADCTPILFADPLAKIIGAAHAGWRGAVDGICERTLAAMVALGADPSRIVAAIGPTISAENYEVGAQFRTEFLALQPSAACHFSEPSGKPWHFDLPGFIEAQLRQSGVTTIERVGGCTYAQPERYFSHRYATHHQIRTGRQVAIIGLS